MGYTLSLATQEHFITNDTWNTVTVNIKANSYSVKRLRRDE
jgi:hypothetical protein